VVLLEKLFVLPFFIFILQFYFVMVVYPVNISPEQDPLIHFIKHLEFSLHQD